MGKPVDWHGANRKLGKPPGMDDLQCSSLPVFTNGQQCVSCWELDDIEIAEIVRTRRVFLSVWFGPSQPPVMIGSEDTIREATLDAGTWKRRID